MAIYQWHLSVNFKGSQSGHGYKGGANFFAELLVKYGEIDEGTITAYSLAVEGGVFEKRLCGAQPLIKNYPFQGEGITGDRF